MNLFDDIINIWRNRYEKDNDCWKGANYQTSFVRDFANSFNEIIDAKADLIILDINIPYTNGEILLKNIRKSLGVPVIMVTSKNTIEDEVLSY